MHSMIEVEKYPCKDKQEAERQEYEIIQKLKSGNNTQIMNTHFPIATKKSYKNRNITKSINEIKWF